MKIFLRISLLLSVLLLLPWHLGLRINLTESMPSGVYRITRITPQRGDVVAFCSSADGRLYAGVSLLCPAGAKPLLKTLWGMPGDEIRTGDDGIVLNGVPLPNSAARSRDSRGREMRSVLEAGIIPDGRALILADHAGSYDSRYFGLVPLAGLKAVRPLLTF
jgi:conjugative transfer signal peptidase TraF